MTDPDPSDCNDYCPPAHAVQLTVYGKPIGKVDPTGDIHARCTCGCGKTFTTQEIERLLKTALELR